MDRYWFLTNTTYGNRLPGDPRGFVGRVTDRRPDDLESHNRMIHNRPGTPCDEDLPGLEEASRSQMKGPPIRFELAHARVALEQFQETARFREWFIAAAAIMVDHFHLVVGVDGDPEPGKILGDFKSWGTRRLSARFGEPPSKTWWTERGSKRRLKDEADVAGAVHYVLDEQPNPLIIWFPESEASVEA